MKAPTLALRFRRFLAGAVAACVTFSAAAHSVWIEATAEGGLILRFAEPDGKFEKSPGHLDELTFPAAFSVVTNGAALAVETVKKRDHFLLVGAASTNVAAAETSYMVMGTPGKPGRRPVFYARWHPARGQWGQVTGGGNGVKSRYTTIGSLFPPRQLRGEPSAPLQGASPAAHPNVESVDLTPLPVKRTAGSSGVGNSGQWLSSRIRL